MTARELELESQLQRAVALLWRIRRNPICVTTDTMLRDHLHAFLATNEQPIAKFVASLDGK